MAAFISFLQSIPDVVWSGVIAATLTLSGVLISNWSNTYRLKLQLRHDATQKAADRTAELRREVYLRTAEELTKASTYLASLPQADLMHTNAAMGLQGFFAEAAKLQLVAEPHTALLVDQLVADYGELLLRLLGNLIPLQRARTNITICNGLYDQAQSEVKRVLVEMTKFNEGVQTNSAIFEALQRSFNFHQSQSQQYSLQRTEHWTEFNNLNVVFCRDLAREMQRLGELQIPVLVAIRQDLGLTGEIEAFKAQMQANTERMTKQLDALIYTLQEGLTTA
jgi:hypothetical protein